MILRFPIIFPKSCRSPLNRTRKKMTPQNYNFPPFHPTLSTKPYPTLPASGWSKTAASSVKSGGRRRAGGDGWCAVAFLRNAPVQRLHPYPTLHFVGVGLLEFRASGTKGWKRTAMHFRHSIPQIPEVFTEQGNALIYHKVLLFRETMRVFHQLEGVDHLLDGGVPLAYVLKSVRMSVLFQIPERNETRGDQTG